MDATAPSTAAGRPAPRPPAPTTFMVEDGTRLHLTDRGDGPPVVLVHGWKGSHRLWAPTAEALLARGHRVVAYDLRGMGESEKPDGPYDFEVMAGDLDDVLTGLGLLDATLVGWSMGCTIVLRHLERGGARVGRAVLLNGPLRLTQADDFPHAMTERQFGDYLEAMEASWPESERAFQAESVLDPAGHPETVERLTAIALQTPLPIGLEIVRAQARLDMRDAVRTSPVPLLAAYADHDPYYPTSLGTWIAEAAPDGRAVTFSRSAHGTPFEEPEAFARVVSQFATGAPA